MNLKDRQKMCSQCDGRIPYEADKCPYCAADQAKTLGQSLAGVGSAQHNRSLQDSLASPYLKGSSTTGRLNLSAMTNSSLEKKKPSLASVGMAVPAAEAMQEESVVKEGSNKAFLPILLLSLAGNLLTIGLLLLLFSHDGALKLEWDASYWFAYCLGAIPLLMFGLKKAKQVS